MVCNHHCSCERSNDLKQFVAIYIVIRVQAATGATPVHNVRRVDERYGPGVFREFLQ